MARRVVLILVLFISSAVPAAAQIGIGFAPLLGVYRAEDADGLRMVGGAVVRIRLSEILGAEGSINYREDEYGRGSMNVKSLPVMVTGLLYPVPFVYGAVGAGWYNTSVRYNDVPGGLTDIPGESRQQFEYHVGAGVELPVYSFVKLVGDIRYVFLNHTMKSVPGSNGVNDNSPIMTAGLLFGF